MSVYTTYCTLRSVSAVTVSQVFSDPLSQTEDPILFTTNAMVLGAWTVWGSQSTVAILAHVCAATQSTRGLGEGEYRWESVVNKYALCQSHQWPHPGNQVVVWMVQNDTM